MRPLLDPYDPFAGGLLGGALNSEDGQQNPLLASFEPYRPQNVPRPDGPATGPAGISDPWDFMHELDRQRWMDEIYRPPLRFRDSDEPYRPGFEPFAGLMR